MATEQDIFEFEVVEKYFVPTPEGLFCNSCKNFAAGRRVDAVNHWEAKHRVPGKLVVINRSGEESK